MDNYFNYFTEIEECFQRRRGTPSLLSTLDWALIESWKEAGIPLDAVCAGIERTFEKYARRPRRFSKVNSLAYCSQQVMEAASQAARDSVERGESGRAGSAGSSPFSPDEIVGFLDQCGLALERAAARCRDGGDEVMAGDLAECASAICELKAPGGESLLADLERLERALTAIEDRVCASLARGSSAKGLIQMREEIDRSLSSCRRTMTAVQIESVERQFLKKLLFENHQLPRLSLFYL